MENKLTLENNILIAKFMGVQVVERNTSPAVYMFEGAMFPEYFYATHYNKYHEDWNVLMLVVENISNMAYDEIGEIGMVIYPDRADIITSDDSVLIEGLSQRNLIEGVFYTVLEFVKWHNAQP